MVSSNVVNPFERFFALLKSLIDMVMSGARNIDYVNDHLQQLVSEQRPDLLVGNFLPGAIDRMLRYWEDRFPRKGRMIMEAIGPAYGNSFARLKQRSHSLNVRKLQDCFWTELKGMHIVMFNRRKIEVYETPADAEWKLLPERRLSATLDEHIRQDFGLLGKDGIGYYCDEWNLQQRLTERSHTRDFIPLELRQILAFECWKLLEHKVGAITRENYGLSTALDPIIELFKSGNIPIGLNEKDEAVVICSEPDNLD